MERLLHDQLSDHVHLFAADADEVGTLGEFVNFHGLDAVAVALEGLGGNGAAIHVDHFNLHLAVDAAHADGGGAGGGVGEDGAVGTVGGADALRTSGEGGDGAPCAVVVSTAEGTHVEVVLGVVVETGERGVGLGGVDGGAAAVAEAAAAVLNLEGGVALAGSPVDVDVVEVDGGCHTEGSIARFGTLVGGEADACPVLAGPVGAADGRGRWR